MTTERMPGETPGAEASYPQPDTPGPDRTPTPLVSFRCPRGLLARVDRLSERDAAGKPERGNTIRALLESSPEMLALCRMELARTFSGPEVSLIADLLNGTLIEDWWTADVLAVEIEDGIALNGSDAKWQVDGAALVKKLLALDPSQVRALLGAVADFWDRVGAGEQPEPARLLEEG